jgi:starch synthase
MKILVQYEYPPPPGGLATQADLLYRGLHELGVDVFPVHYKSNLEKEWYYRWFKPDLTIGVGYWGYTPDIILEPQKFGIIPVPWLVADGYVANYREVLNKLPLILVTSHWVKEVYERDGIRGDNIEILPVGCDTQKFIPMESDNPMVIAIRQELGIPPDAVMILTVGGDGASKGSREVMQALCSMTSPNPARPLPDWRYICKVWPQPRTDKQNRLDLALAKELGIQSRVKYITEYASRNILPYLLAACDIYAAPSRLEGFGMPHIEANACGKPVLGIAKMGLLDTMVHGQTAFLAGVGEENWVKEVVVAEDTRINASTHIILDKPRIADYRADVKDLCQYLTELIADPNLRRQMGEAGRKRVVENFDYLVVAQKFLKIVKDKLGIS